ncbi:MAG: Type IV pilus biogenesis and competence protein PilQ [Syntrophomonadaceae bacterium]|nr:Type IV pilus biogenesis and competence protein PilQ [Bacillota bacterium]
MAEGQRPERVEAVLSLRVTPTITPDDNVYLKVIVTNDAIDPGTTPPTINRQSIDTQALVKSGETLVLGGIYTTIAGEKEIGVPLLSKIPILGWLFKTKERGPDIISELLIFITPTII